jgi:hypothetical protein
MKINPKKIALFTMNMTPEQRRLVERIINLSETGTPTAAAIREQFHCFRATAEVIANALTEYRMTPAQRKAEAKAVAAAKAASLPRGAVRGHRKPRTLPGTGAIHAEFTEAAIKQRDEGGWKGPQRWSDELNKWVPV